jgi:hypothetical protein
MPGPKLGGGQVGDGAEGRTAGQLNHRIGFWHACGPEDAALDDEHAAVSENAKRSVELARTR